MKRFLADTRAFSTFGRLFIIYFLIGGGVVFSAQTYCDAKQEMNASGGGCDLEITGVNLSAINDTVNNTQLPQEIRTGVGAIDFIANAVGWTIGGVLSFISTAYDVITWPGVILGAISGFPVILKHIIEGFLTFLFVIAGYLWLRGVQ